jgi:hypothetical protein
MPPLSLYIGGKDELVDGQKLIARFETVEKEVLVMRAQIDEEYEHLDCIWSMDCIERIGVKVREDIWFCVEGEGFVTPEGCSEEDRGKYAKKQNNLKGDTNSIEADSEGNGIKL